MPSNDTPVLSLPIDMRVSGLGPSRVARLVRPGGRAVARMAMSMFDTQSEAQVHTDDAGGQLLARVAPHGVFNFASSYMLRAPDGRPMGEVATEPARAFWRTAMTGRVADAQAAPFQLQSTTPAAEAVGDFLGKLPLIGAVVLTVAKVRYEVTRDGGACVAVIDQNPSALGESYSMRRTTRLTLEEQSFCALFMLVALALHSTHSSGG